MICLRHRSGIGKIVASGAGIAVTAVSYTHLAAGYEQFMEYYRQLLKVERAAVEELGGWHAGD